MSYRLDFEKACNILSIGARISSVLRFGCEKLKKKNTQILERGFQSASKLLDSCIQKEHGSLTSEMYGLWRNSNYTTLLL